MTRNIFATSCFLALTACGGGGDETPADKEPITPEPTSVISTSGGAISNGSICLDTNHNRTCDTSEVSALTDSQGLATFKDADLAAKPSYVLSVKAGDSTDLESGAILKSYSLYAPSGSLVISPMTNVVVKVMDKEGVEYPDAVNLVAQALSASNNDLTDLDTSIMASYSESGAYTQSVLNWLSRLLVELDISGTINDSNLLSFLTEASTVVAGLEVSEIASIAPVMSYESGIWTVEANYGPVSSVTSLSDIAISLTESISPIDFDNYFSDADGDPLSYRMTPSISGLNFVGSVLQGTPSNMLNSELHVQATDGKVWSSAITFNLKVGEAPPAPQSPEIKSAVNLLPLSQEHDFIHSNESGLYGFTFSEINGSYYLDLTWHRLDGTSQVFSYDNEGMGDTILVSHPKTAWDEQFEDTNILQGRVDTNFYYEGIHSRGVGGFSEPAKGTIPLTGEKLVFTTRKGTRYEYNPYVFSHWSMSFDSVGTPSLTKVGTPTAPVCNASTVMINLGISCDPTRSAGLSFSHDSVGYGHFNRNEMVVMVGDGRLALVTDDAMLKDGDFPAGLKVALRKADGTISVAPFEFFALDGTPIRELPEEFSVSYSPEQDAIYFLARYPDSDNDYRTGFYMLGYNKLGTDEVKVTRFIGSKRGNAIYPSTNGVYITPSEYFNIQEWLPETDQLIDTEFNSGSSVYPLDMVGYPYPVGKGFIVPILAFTYDPYQLLYVEVK